ncbi:hypothetical protein ACOMHN_041869 [Nucella lapillus]
MSAHSHKWAPPMVTDAEWPLGKVKGVRLAPEHEQCTSDVMGCELYRASPCCSGKHTEGFDMPKAERETTDWVSREYHQQTNYNKSELKTTVEDQLCKLTPDQRSVFDDFMKMVENIEDNSCRQNMMFVDAPGGTGKTFIINLILAAVRSTGRIALATASSGIAATLLQGGKTLHSTFKVPLSADKQDRPMRAIKKGTTLARVIGDTAAIIIDEAPMTNKAVFEAMDRTLQDLKQSAKPMGGIPILFCGDFRQILPVVLHGTRSNIVNASIKKSYMWPDINVKHLTTNMRAHLTGNTDAASMASFCCSNIAVWGQ